jgi:hypothetical protein
VKKLNRRARVFAVLVGVAGLSLTAAGCSGGPPKSDKAMQPQMKMDYESMMKGGGMKGTGGAAPGGMNPMTPQGGAAQPK